MIGTDVVAVVRVGTEIVNGTILSSVGALFPAAKVDRVPRYGFNPGVDFALSLITAAVIPLIELPEQLPLTRNDRAIPADALRGLLRCIHQPSNEDEWATGTDPDVRWVVAEAIQVEMNRTPTTMVVLPTPRMLKSAQEAEAYAGQVLQGLGFAAIKLTSAGADGGVDVRAAGAVAQVKMEAGKTGRPALQALSGIGHLERALPVFFSLAGYTEQALEWSEQAQIACFEFAFDGSIVPISSLARRLMNEGATMVLRSTVGVRLD